MLLHAVKGGKVSPIQKGLDSWQRKLIHLYHVPWCHSTREAISVFSQFILILRILSPLWKFLLFFSTITVHVMLTLEKFTHSLLPSNNHHQLLLWVSKDCGR